MDDWNCGRCRSRNTDEYKGRRREKCTSCYISRDKVKPTVLMVKPTVPSVSGAACVTPAAGFSSHITPRRDSNGCTPTAGAPVSVNPETRETVSKHQPQMPAQPSPQQLPFSPVHPSPDSLHQPPPPSHQPQGPPPPQVPALPLAPTPPPLQARVTEDQGAGVFDWAWTREKAAAQQLPPLAVRTTADAAPACAAARRTRLSHDTPQVPSRHHRLTPLPHAP